MGSECQRSPPVLRCQLASQVHLWGQTANQNKGKRVPRSVAAQQTPSVSTEARFKEKSVFGTGLE